jgi:hypothetical protein
LSRQDRLPTLQPIDAERVFAESPFATAREQPDQDVVTCGPVQDSPGCFDRHVQKLQILLRFTIGEECFWIIASV